VAEVAIWAAGTLYQPGDLARPTNSGVVSQPPLANPSMEAGNTGWTATGSGSFAIDNTAPVFDGTFSMKLGVTNNPNGQVLTVVNNTNIAVTPGQIVTLNAYIRSIAPTSQDSSRLQLQINWYTAALAPLAPTKLALDPTIVNNNARIDQNGIIDFASVDVWTLLTVEGVAPAGAAFWTAAILCLWGDSNFKVDAVSYSYALTAAPNTLIFRAVQAAAGFSGSTEPVWPTVIGNQVVDNEVTWEAVSGNSVTWEASRILVTGAVEPAAWPLAVNGSVVDNTISWQLDSRRVTDSRVPTDSSVVLTGSSKVFAADDDIINFSATTNPLDWSTRDDAGYIGFGLQQYGGTRVTAMGLYRGNLAAFNSQGCQLWQLDEDPAGITYLDAIPVACTFPKTVQPVGDDLGFLSDLGIRSLGLSGAAVNLQGGYFGQQVDPITEDLLAEAVAAGYEPRALYWPARGQAWWFFGDQALVLTINAGSDQRPNRSWSRYTFPWVVDDWTIQGTDLVLRAGNLIEVVDVDALCDDEHDVASTFQIDPEVSTFYATPSGWAAGAASVALGTVHNYVNTTPVQLFGASKTGLFSATTVVTGAEGATAVTLSQAITALMNDVAIFRYPAEGPFTPANNNVVGEGMLKLQGAGVQTYLRAGTVIRIAWASGTDWNYLRKDVVAGELDLPLENPLEHLPTAVRLYPAGATLVNSSTADVMYVPIPLAANVTASASITLTRGLPALATGVQMIACAFQQTTVAGGQGTANVTLGAVTAFANQSTVQVNFTNTAASENWQVPAGVTAIDALLVGGGGSGDDFFNFNNEAGGGGGGAVRTFSAIPVTPLETLTIAVGVGGVTPGSFGAGTELLRTGGTVLIADATGGAPSDNGNAVTAGNAGGEGANLFGVPTGTAPGNDGGAGAAGTAGGGGGGAGGDGGAASANTGGAGGAGLLPDGGVWGTGIGESGLFGGGGGGDGATTDGTRGTGGGAANTGGGGNASLAGQDGWSGFASIRYGAGGGTPPETGFPAFPVLIGAFAAFIECTPFTGVIQWPFLDMKSPGTDKELLGFDLVIAGDAAITVGYNQRFADYDAGNGWWTAPYTLRGDTLPDDMIPYSVTGPTFSLRLEFEAEQSWEWFASTLYIKDLVR
jgi:hypothetical protein